MRNLYRQFIDLIPQTPLQIGTVTTHNSDGTSTITLHDGAQIRARGQTVAIGLPAFTRNGIIEGPAPALPIETHEV